jgi:hypothetical protein
LTFPAQNSSTLSLEIVEADKRRTAPIVNKSINATVSHPKTKVNSF